MFIVRIWQLLYFSVIVASSELHFTASPQNVQPPVTTKLCVRCSIHDSQTSTVPSATSSSTLVGRAAPDSFRKGSYQSSSHLNNAAPMRQNHGLKRSAPANKSDDPLRHISAISITRNGAPLATVSPYNSAKAETPLDLDIHVTGDVSNTSGQLGFLELVWNFPTSDQAGEYVCMVTGVTEAGHSATFTYSLEIRKLDIALDDLIRQIHGLQKTAFQQNITNHLQKQKLEQQQSKVDAQQVTIEKQQLTLTSQQGELNDLKSEVKESRHVESGSLNCGENVSSWPTGSSSCPHPHHFCYFALAKTMNATFQTNYSSPPVVFLSTKYLYISKDQHTHYGIQLLSVDNHGFSMRCGSGSSPWLLGDIEVSWISISA